MLAEFETERLLLRPRTMADFDACLLMDRDPMVTKFVDGPWNDWRKHETFLKEKMEASYGDGLGYWSIFALKNPRQFLGWVLLVRSDCVGSEIEIGWRLNRLAWGKGYATEAAKSIAKYALVTLRIPRIVADIAPANLSSIRIAEKIGMQVEEGGQHIDEFYQRYFMTKRSLV